MPFYAGGIGVYYIENTSTDAAFNLALEQHLFDTFPDDLFMLWRNSNAVIVGIHQDTASEINEAFIDDNNITVVRRLSGGGAVFHDLGNLNFTIITHAPDNAELDFRVYCRPIIDALAALGINASASGGNDISVGDKKISGNAWYLRNGRLMHHGTILFDTDIEKMENALNVPEQKLASKGIKSVRARVINIRELLDRDMSTGDFIAFLRGHLIDALCLEPHTLSTADLAAAEALRKKRYATREWNYGVSPNTCL